MNRTGSQKALLVISILNIVSGALALLLVLFGTVLTVSVGTMNSAQLAEAGVDAASQGVATVLFAVLTFLGFVVGVLSIVEGILGIRAANDNQKIMPVWILAIIGLAISALSVIVGLFQRAPMQDILTDLGTLIVSGLMFWIANNIKVQAGK